MIGNKPKVFKRGGDFSIILTLPSYVQPGHFADWTPTAQVRKYQNDASSGFIGDLTFEWLVDSQNMSFRLSSTETANWPLGLAEMDVLFTSPTGKKTQTQTVIFKIDRGITRTPAPVEGA